MNMEIGKNEVLSRANEAFLSHIETIPTVACGLNRRLAMTKPAEAGYSPHYVFKEHLRLTHRVLR